MMTGFDDQVFMKKHGTTDGLNDNDSFILIDIENSHVPQYPNNIGLQIPFLSMVAVIRIM